MAKSKISPGQRNFAINFLNATEKELADAEAGVKTTTRSGYFGGAVEVEDLTARAIDFAKRLEPAIGSMNESLMKRIHPKLTLGNAIQKFDMARMLVLSINSEAFEIVH